MKSLEIESWAIRILERVENHLPVEDSRVELKSAWPDPIKTARRLAGHANAARGELILWLIGADEKRGVIAGANYNDLASWFPQVKGCFESEIPALQDLNITYKGKTVAALCFDTTRFPYVVKNSKGGEIQFEVPWRDGTAVRTATRSDLVLMLTPFAWLPKLEVIAAEISGQVVRKPLPMPITFKVTVYLVPLDIPITIPFHKCSAKLRSGTNIVAENWRIEMDTPLARQEKHNRKWASIGQRGDTRFPAHTSVDVQTGPKNIEATEDEILIRGAGKIEVVGVSETVPDDWSELNLALTFTEAVSGLAFSIEVNCPKSPTEEGSVWRHTAIAKPSFMRDLVGLV
jgi:hypothetical protein